MSPEKRFVAALLAVGLLLPASAAQAGPPELAILPPPPPVDDGAPSDAARDAAQRLAFTHGRADLFHITVHRSANEGEGAQPSYAGEEEMRLEGEDTRYRGEASAVGRQDGLRVAYISTEQDPAGDVYVGVGERKVHLTCGPSVESNPVLSPDGESVAFVSDAGGSQDIWVARSIDRNCAEPEQLTFSPEADTWPTWSPGSGSLVFSSTRSDPLGDLYFLPVPEAPEDGQNETGLIRLTEGTDAETQPNAFAQPNGDWAVVFRTTEFRGDGSLAVITLPSEPDRDDFPAVPISLWTDPEGDEPMSSSEPDVSPGGRYLSFRSSHADPAGDVWIVPLDVPEAEPSGPRAGRADAVAVAARPGRAESYPSWAADFSGRGERSSGVLLFSAGVPDADVQDANAADGSDPRDIAAGPRDDPGSTARFDESSPAYSPDGMRVVWSQKGDGGRRLAVANADGSEAAFLDYERQSGNVDTDPAWSPDGKTIAFTRAGSSTAPDAAVWVTEVGESAERAQSRRVSEPPADSGPYVEEDPTWSPDGLMLAVSRTFHSVELAVKVSVPSTAVRGEQTTAMVTVTNNGTTASTAGKVTLELVGLEFLAPDAADAACVAAEGGKVECDLRSLKPGQPASFVVDLLPKVAGAGAVRATADSGGHGDDLDDNLDEADVTVVVGYDLRLELSVEPPVFAGQPFVARAIVSNLGTKVIPAAVVTFTLDGLTFLEGDDVNSACRGGEGTVECDVGELIPQQSVPVSIGLLSAEDGDAPLAAEVVAEVKEDDLDNNRDDASVSVQPPPDLVLVLPTETRLQPSDDEYRADVRVGVRNDGRGEASEATLVWPKLPPGISVTGSGCVPVTDATTCPVPAVSPGTTIELPVTVSATVSGDRTLTLLLEDVLPGEVATENNSGTLPLRFGESQVELLRLAAMPLTVPEPPVEVPRSGVRPDATVGDRKTHPLFALPASAAPELWVLEVGDREGAALARPACEGECPVRGRSPAWSPNGNDIAFSYRGQLRIAHFALPDTPESLTDLALDEILTVAVVDSEGPPPARERVSAADEPAWFRGADPLLAFTGQPAGVPEQPGIYVIATDGTGLRRLVQGRGPESEPAVQGGERNVEVTLTLDRPTGWTGGRPVRATITVTNVGTRPASGIRVEVTLPGFLAFPGTDGCAGTSCTTTSLDPDQSRVFTPELDMPPPIAVTTSTQVIPELKGDVTVEVTVDSIDEKPEDDIASRELTVLQPRVWLSPEVVKPGDVVLAVLEDLPPGEVELRWSRGVIDAATATPVGGRLSWPGVIVRRDQLGQRELVVTSPDELFGDIRAPLLVVPRPADAGAEESLIGRQ
jgi:Tol biopolymer transport system component